MSTELNPCNRYILLDEYESASESTPTVLVPDDYRTEPKHKVYTIKAVPPSCALDNVVPGRLAVVEASMVEEITIMEQRYYLVLENYVVATLGGTSG